MCTSILILFMFRCLAFKLLSTLKNIYIYKLHINKNKHKYICTAHTIILYYRIFKWVCLFAVF